MQTKICVVCQSSFVLTPMHQGYANRCLNCNLGDVQRYVAKVAYPSKNSSLVEIEITLDVKAANAFNKAQRRNFAGPLQSIIAARETSVGAEARKDGSGAEPGALYYSNVGEKRTVKR